MSWGAPLGFSSGPSPFERIVTAAHGEPGWYCRMRQVPTADHPARAILTTPVARAVFTDADDARLFVDHPGDIAVLARRYLAWIEHGTDPRRDSARIEIAEQSNSRTGN